MATTDLTVSPLPEDPGRASSSRLPALVSPPPGMGAYAGMAGTGEDEPVNWGRYIAACRRYGWLMGVVVILGTTAGILATRYVKPSYAASATIWVETEDYERRGPIRPAELLGSGNWADFIRSTVVLDSVVMTHRLFLEPAVPADSLVFSGFKPGKMMTMGTYVLSVTTDGKRWSLLQNDHELARGAVGDSIGRPLGWFWAPTAAQLGRDRRIKFSVLQPREVSNRLMKKLNAFLPENGNFMKVSLSSTDRLAVAPILNSIAQTFVDLAAVLKKKKLTEVRLALESQVTQAQASLRDAESRYRSFQIGTITQPRNSVLMAPGLVQTQPQATQQYFAQKGELELVRADRRQLEAVLARARQGAVVTDAFLTIAAAKSAPDLSMALADLSKTEAEYAANSRRYTAEHPIMVQLSAQIQHLRTRRIPELAQALIDQLKSQEGDLEGRITVAGTELREVPAVTITEMRLQREYDAANNLYNMLAGRLEEARLAELGAVPDVRMLEQAVVPTRPSRNTTPIIILGAFLGSLGAAIGLAIVLDRIDGRFHYPEQVTNELGLAILGAVPACRKNRSGEIAPEEAQQVVEAFRTIRLNLAHSYGAAGPITLTVSSPGAGDGKSFVSSNLAVSFAQAGYRTLLIDGDIRRGELHRMFGVDRRPGMLDYLTGVSTHEEIIRPTSQSGLWVVPCGTRRQHGPELLGSAAMSGLMAWFKSRFNVIILDSPPLGAGIDPFVLGTVTGHLMLVFRAGETDRQMAQAKLPLLERLPVRMLGAVLNEVAAGGIYRYYNYIYGYTSDEEPAPAQLAGGTSDAGTQS